MKEKKFKIILSIISTAIITFIITSYFNISKLIYEEYYKTDYEYDNATFEKLQKVKEVIDKNYLNEYDEEELINGAIRGMLDSIEDDYATYYDEEEYKEFYIETEGEYEGIGIYITYDSAKKMVYVISPLEDSPAAEAGMLPGDYIYKINEEETVGSTIDEVGAKLKGPQDTTVKITVLRYDDNDDYELLDYEVTRKNIIVNPIKTKIYEDKIGYIKLTSFDETSYIDFKKAYDELTQNKEIQGLILDLRNNPGGLLTVACEIADLIVPSGKIVYTVNKQGKEDTIYSLPDKIEIPLVVLINEGSASASEVLTGAIKDYGMGKIVGVKSFGKGVVQTLKSLKDGTYMKLTTAEYFSPNGTKIHETGITPDIEVKLPENLESYYNISYEDDTQLQKGIEELNKMINNL